MRKPCKVIPTENGNSIQIFGNHHYKELLYQIPEWNEDDNDPEYEPCFKYRGNTYFLADFMRTNEGDLFYDLGFHGYHGDSFFSGILIKYHKKFDDCVQVYSFIA